MNWFPEFMKIRLEEWVNSLEWDWVISRQRYFATPIPIWHCENCDEVVLARIDDCYVDPTIDKPPEKSCPSCGGSLIGSEDVFDTWMDSSISPLYNTFWHRDMKKFERLYPMSVRPQSHDIIRTWAFYTILRCNLLTDEKPFENIMMGGFILSEDGTPMHASLGNVIDPLGIIEEYGTDAFRCYAASCSLGEDNAFREMDVIRGKKLLRKLWNVLQFIGSNLPADYTPKKPETFTMLDRWILTKYSMLVDTISDMMNVYDYAQAMKQIEYFLWHELADHYLELVKSYIYNNKEQESVFYTLYTLGLGMIKVFAPFFPHITEELYHQLFLNTENVKSIHIASWPDSILSDIESMNAGEWVKQYVSEVRSFKSEQKIALNAPLNSVKTYASKDRIKALKDNAFVVIETLKLPSNHEFVEGKPDIKEKITEIIPNYAAIGPQFKNESKSIVQFIKNHQEDLIKIIENTGDLTWNDIKVDIANVSDESLLNNGFVSVTTESVVKGEKDHHIVSFDGFYLLVSSEVIS